VLSREGRLSRDREAELMAGELRCSADAGNRYGKHWGQHLAMGTSPTSKLYRSVSFINRAIASSEEVPFGIVRILPGWLAFNAVTAFFGQMPMHFVSITRISRR
jgi:hypothetical protein